MVDEVTASGGEQLPPLASSLIIIFSLDSIQQLYYHMSMNTNTMQKYPTTVIVAAHKPVADKLYSAPVHVADKEFLINEAARTGLSQKDIVARAIAALRKHAPIPMAMPIKLK